MNAEGEAYIDLNKWALLEGAWNEGASSLDAPLQTLQDVLNHCAKLEKRFQEVKKEEKKK